MGEAAYRKLSVEALAGLWRSLRTEGIFCIGHDGMIRWARGEHRRNGSVFRLETTVDNTLVRRNMDDYRLFNHVTIGNNLVVDESSSSPSRIEWRDGSSGDVCEKWVRIP